jgi:hypothetical protein
MLKFYFNMAERKVISPRERLVPDNFQPDVQAAIVRVMRDGYPGYPPPRKRLRMSSQEYDRWVADGRPAEVLVGTPGNRPSWYIDNHPGRRDAAAREARKRGELDDYDGSQTFPPGTFGRGIATDSKGAPLHPFTRFIVTEGLGVTSLGANWKLGRTPTADAIVLLVSEKERLEVVVVTKNELKGKKRANGLPGETVESKDKNYSLAVVRAIGEEVGVPISDVAKWPRLPTPVYASIGADPRDTLNSWRLAYAEVYMPNEAQAKIIERTKPKDTDEIARVGFMPVSPALMRTFTAMHPELLQAGIREWQKQTGLVVAKDGTVGVPARTR